MVSEDSELYRAHPDWALGAPHRPQVQYLPQGGVDMVPNLLPGEIQHQLAPPLGLGAVGLGVYDLLERFRRDYPDLLIEGCSGGGGRFDAGMLYYTPQIWCSDNTDAIDRLRIQCGTTFCYPVSSVGAHVSAVPKGSRPRRRRTMKGSAAVVEPVTRDTRASRLSAETWAQACV